MKPATLRGVAERAEVSIATVSKVVNGISKGVSDQTAIRVRNAIKELNYRPNRMGRELRTRRNYIVGMAIVDDSPTFLTDPYITHLVAGLSNYLGTRDYGLLLHGIRPEKFDDSFLVKESIVVALCLILSGSQKNRKQYLAKLGLIGHPMVIFQERPVRGLADCCFINQDDEGGAMALAEKIVRQNARNIFILIPDLAWHAVEARVKGYKKIFDQHQLAYRIIRCDEHVPQSINNALESAIAQFGAPDMVVGANDLLAYVACRFLTGKGYRVPKDIGVTGFNAFEPKSLIKPQLESVRSPAYAMGEAGGMALLKRLEKGAFETKELTLSVEPVKGKTLS